MSTRIRYKKQPDGTLASNYFKTIDNEIMISINPDSSFKLYSADLNYVYAGKAKTLSVAKKEAKKMLITLGTIFESEVRPRYKEDGYDIMVREALEDLEHDQ